MLTIHKGGLSSATDTVAAMTPRERFAMRQACREFEGILVGTVLKESMKMSDDAEDTMPGGEVFREFVMESTASSIGRSEQFGIARMLYKQLTGLDDHDDAA